MDLISPAKLNLGLKVLGKRPDGFHDLASVFVPLTLGDTVTLEPCTDGRVTVEADVPGVPLDDGNLAVRAALLMQDTLRCSRGVHIRLIKRIPTGGGLGGGSSNAATVLKGLNSLWDAGLDAGNLERLALQIGSDVPFFIGCVPAIVRGRGERILPVRIDGATAILLVNPGFQISTREAFGALRIGLTEDRGYIRFLNSVVESREVALAELLRHVDNDFLHAVSEAHPPVRDILVALQQSGATCSSMSGSGSTLFGCFPTQATAEAAARTLTATGYSCEVCGIAP